MRYGLMRTVETTPQRSQVVDGLSFTKPVAFDLPSTATGIDRVEVALVDGTSLTFTTSQKKRFVNATLASDQVIIEGLTGESGYQFQ
jgi:hypothetical protein